MTTTHSERGTQPAAPDQVEDIKWLRAILMNPSLDRPTRVGAARRLVNMGVAEAITPLDEAVRSGDRNLLMAVLDALGDTRAPLQLLDALADALRSPPEGVLDALAFSVARYGDRALAIVRDLARDRDRPDPERLGPIHALGSFRNQAAAIELMAMLEDAGEGPELTAAVCAALRRGTGLPYGDDPTEWKAWWSEARDQPPEQWLTNLVQRLAEQLALAEQQNERQREEARKLERRIAEAFRELYPLAGTEEQMRRLPSLMDDPLTAVRLFAVDRVSRYLRDSVRVPDEVQAQLAELLDDEDPEIRRRTARLLDQLMMESAGERMARRLSVETSPEVAAVLMDMLTKRPTPAALGPVQSWLADPANGGRAALLAWEIVVAAPLDEAQLLSLGSAVRSADYWRQSPQHARLLAAIGDDQDIGEVTALLDDGNQAMQRAVAEALLFRGLRQPLLDRVQDEVVYPYAVRLLGREAQDMSGVRRLLALQAPNETGHAVWQETIVKVAGRLPASAVLELDSMLATLQETASQRDAMTQLRGDVLRRGREVAGDSDEPAIRDELLTRLAQQYLLLDQALQAYETIEPVNAQGLTETARRIKFEAAALSGHYDVAAQLKPAPEPWLALLTRTTERNAQAAITLRDEVQRRFGPQLQGDLKTEFDRLSERLSHERVEPETGPSV